jgi:hypothetical protein
MLPVNSKYRLDVRSTAEMTVGDLAHLKAVLESSEAVKGYERENRPERGGLVFGFVPLFLLYLLMECRKTTYRGVVKNLSDDDCMRLGLTDRNGRPKRPSSATLNGFVNKRLPDAMGGIGKEMAAAVIGMSPKLIITIDSTPLQASRYNYDADYSPYYEIRMDKCHMLMVNGYPMFMIQSGGNAGDNPFAEPLVRMLSGYEIGGKDIEIYVDGGYDAFLTYAAAYMVTGAVMRCNQGADAVRSGVGGGKIRGAYARMWKAEGYDPYKKNDTDFMLRFLFMNGEQELVGRYLRDRSMDLDEEESKPSTRFVCETMHRSMKRWVAFDIFRIRRATKALRIRCRFLCVQMLSLLFRGYMDADA